VGNDLEKLGRNLDERLKGIEKRICEAILSRRRNCWPRGGDRNALLQCYLRRPRLDQISMTLTSPVPYSLTVHRV